MTTEPVPASRAPAARLKHRIPVRVRHYWKLLATCVAAVAALVVLAGNTRISPIVTSPAAAKHDEVVTDVEGTVDLFDSSVAHTVTLTYGQADYQRMFDEYMETGEKEYVRVDATIDGTLIRDVGIRLKGNSTLSGVTHNGRTRSLFEGRGGGPGGGRPNRPEGEFPEGGFPGMPEGGMPGMGADGQNPPTTGGDGQGLPGGMMGGGPGGFGAASLDSSRPEELPWLMSFDEFSDGRRYQGHSEVAVRVSGMGGGSTVLNEAVSLAVMDAAGQPAQGYAYAAFQVNGRPVKARLLVEHPDENFADSLGNGVLYKSLATSQFTYKGEDPTDYEDDFKQINNKGSYDLKPVIDLVKWANEASDAEFDAHLADYVDVDSFAQYTALQNLLLNFDDMSGPGKNYYLWYDIDSKKFKVISWDHNLTFSGSATAGPHDSTSMGGAGGFPGGGDFQPPEGMQLPEGFTPPAGAGPGGGGFGGLGGNKLKERFLASEAFKKAYEDAYRDLHRKIYADKAAEKVLDTISATLNTVSGIDAAGAKADIDKLRTLLQQRAASLAKDKVITG
ncbi:CotH kinase family protein [Catellatospora tritici]|uniref:CotH kinase family protein n=1 Tax=Catellatospora tritici TaxID=2851566 RepID=UPI001C2D4F33|nr:CotH kinase family protein [Catellatospora tritici]MBV1854413.1 CotH kinase family protein [Catellatospora tritici]